MKKTYLIGIAIFVAVFSLFLQAVSAGPPSGAIFTTLEDGTRVNANHYDDKRDVYLDGGPGPNAPQDAAGLDDGNYYFQVTDPSGKRLLSQDPVYCREFLVEDGIITELVSIGRTYKYKGDDVPCYKDGWEYGKHDTGVDVDHDALTIQLMPYKDTPNNGGVYKAWATPTEHFDGDPNKVDNGYSPGYFHGFVPKYSKTDNFKVKKKPKPTPELWLCKFGDMNGNGKWDTEELGISGWAFYVTDPLAVQNTHYSGEDGCVMLNGLSDGYYEIEEELPEDWSVTATIVNGNPETPSVTVTIEVDKRDSLNYSVTFGNFECFTVDGYKFNDLDGDGEKDIGEPGIESWGITLYRSEDGETWEEYDSTETDSNGYYSFEVCESGEYKVVEEERDDWTPTSETSFTFTAISGVDQGEFNFLNFQCFEVNGHKYDDKYGDGDWDEGDTGIESWKITLYKKDESGSWEKYDETTTDSTGYYSFEVCEGGEFKVVEEAQSGWLATSPTEHAFTAMSGKTWTYDFFNYKPGKICGKKWYDLNKNEEQDTSEVIIEGFKIELYKNGDLYATAMTDENGEYCFYDLGPGDYEVKEVMPNNPGDYWNWIQTYPAEGWVFEPLISGSMVDDADFGNVVEYIRSLALCYWWFHISGEDRDPTYDLLPSNPMEVDVETADGDYLVETGDEAEWVFNGAGTGAPSCEGKCRDWFRAQVLTLHMNLLKFSEMGDTVYIYSGDPYSGKTVQEIYDAAVEMLADGEDHDFSEFQETITRINKNVYLDPGEHVLLMKDPPEPDYS